MEPLGRRRSGSRFADRDSFPRTDRSDGNGTAVHLSPDDEIRLEPGTLVRAEEYGGRVFGYAERHWRGYVRFESVSVLDPLSGFAIDEERLAEAFAAGDLERVDSIDPADRVRTLATALRGRFRAFLTPPEKGDVPDWKR